MIFDGKKIVIKFPQIRAAVPSFSRRRYHAADQNQQAGAGTVDKLKAQFHRDLHEVMLRDPKIAGQTGHIALRNSKALKIKAALSSVQTRSRDVA